MTVRVIHTAHTCVGSSVTVWSSRGARAVGIIHAGHTAVAISVTVWSRRGARAIGISSTSAFVSVCVTGWGNSTALAVVSAFNAHGLPVILFGTDESAMLVAQVILTFAIVLVVIASLELVTLVGVLATGRQLD